MPGSAVGKLNSAKEAVAAAKAEAAKRFSLNVRNGARNVPVVVKKTNKNIHVVTLAEGDELAEVTSSDENAVSAVKSGASAIAIKGKKAGKTAAITVTSRMGGSVSFTVKVQKKASATKAKSIKMAKTTTLKAGETFDLTTVINPVTTKDKIKCTIDKKGKKVITVSGKGIITARRAGTAKLTIRCGSKKKTVKIKVE